MTKRRTDKCRNTKRKPVWQRSEVTDGLPTSHHSEKILLKYPSTATSWCAREIGRPQATAARKICLTTRVPPVIVVCDRSARLKSSVVGINYRITYFVRVVGIKSCPKAENTVLIPQHCSRVLQLHKASKYKHFGPMVQHISTPGAYWVFRCRLTWLLTWPDNFV